MTDEQGPTIPPATIEEIESVPGLRTALEIIGHSAFTAREDGRVVIEFTTTKTDDDQLQVADITEHVETLEAKYGD